MLRKTDLLSFHMVTLRGCWKLPVRLLFTSSIDPDHMSFTQMLLSSMGSGAVISLLISPVELLKCRLQIEQSYDKSVKKSTSLSVIRDVLKEDGIFGLFRGLSLTLLREVPGTSIWFIVYNNHWTCILGMSCLCGHSSAEDTHAPQFRWWESLLQDHWGNVHCLLLFSGIVYWSVIYPIDTIKSIQQTDPNYSKFVNASGWKRLRQSSTYMSKIVHNLGFRGLYNGIQFSLLRAVPANAVLFLSYEYAFRLFNHFFWHVCLTYRWLDARNSFHHSHFSIIKMDSFQQSTVSMSERGISQEKVFEQGMQKLTRYRQISVIGLCEKGDVRFCRYSVRFWKRWYHV